jgi:hypothetical protein
VDSVCHDYELEGGLANSDTFAFAKANHFKTEERKKAIEWLHPNGLDNISASKSCILCVTNEDVDLWNAEIQKENKNQEVPLPASDEFADVDDDNGHLAKLFTPSIQAELNNVASVPPSILLLKENDICIVLRSLKTDNIPTNARLRIRRIGQRSIIGQLIDDGDRIVTIPKIRFNFYMKGGRSYKIRRTQFPLRLAYAMTVNKCQGQTLERVLLDTTVCTFSHGHLYVALSRVRSRLNIRFYCDWLKGIYHYNDGWIDRDDEILLNNVYCQSILDKFI